MDISDNKFKVCVRCTTYNQAPYVEECLNGFTSQQTTFPYLCTIIDDASTDGEQEVLAKYLGNNFSLREDIIAREETDDYKMILAQHRTNINCFFAVYFLKYNHWSNSETRARRFEYIKRWEKNSCYIAICEGDDYWIDSNKIQKQYEIMESNSKNGLCYTEADSIVQKIGELKHSSKQHKYENVKNLILTNPIMTLTSMFRSSLFFEYQEDVRPSEKNWLAGDYPMWIWMGIHSDIVYINEVTAVYRILENSASHSTNNDKQIKMYLSDYDIRRYFIDKYYPEDKKLLMAVEDIKNRRVGSIYERSGNRKEILKHYKAIFRKTNKEKILIALYSVGLYKLIRFIRKNMITK